MYSQTLHIFLTFAEFSFVEDKIAFFTLLGKDNMRGRHTQCTYGTWMDGWMGLALKGKAFIFFLSVCWIHWQSCRVLLGDWSALIWTLSLLRFTFFFHFQFYLCIYHTSLRIQCSDL